MPAIRPHSTEVSTGPWDGPMHEARLRLDEDEAYYRKAYAWQDPEGDPRTKAAYRFIHHEVAPDGTIGPANTRACLTGIAVLNGARGGTKIPDADKLGVWRHLARHLEDADVEAPPLRRAGKLAPEVRGVPLLAPEIRRDGEGPRRLAGVAAVYGQPTQIGRMVEVIMPGAFAKSLQERDIIALWNHNADFPLGRVSRGTLRLDDSADGLAFEIVLPETSYAADLAELVQRGDVAGASIGFVPIRTELSQAGERRIVEAELIEVSPVTLPAYPQTSVSLRYLLSDQDLGELASHLGLDAVLDAEEAAHLLDRISSAPESRGDHHPLQQLRLELLRRELDALEALSLYRKE